MKWMYEHGVLTATIVLFLMFLLGFPTYQMFTDITVITGSATGAYTALLGAPIIGTAIALFKWRANKFDNSKGSDLKIDDDEFL